MILYLSSYILVEIYNLILKHKPKGGPTPHNTKTGTHKWASTNHRALQPHVKIVANFSTRQNPQHVKNTIHGSDRMPTTDKDKSRDPASVNCHQSQPPAYVT